jgi:hypothetical protein
LGQGLDKARSQLKQLAGLGIDLDAITQTLQDDRVAGFAKSFESLMAGVAAKRDQLTAKSDHAWRMGCCGLPCS